MARAGKYRAGLRERLGRVPLRICAGEKRGGIWIHAVSVGEVLAIAKLAEELRREHPQLPLFISTTTAAGQKLARERYGEESVFYFPLDFAFAVRPYLRALQPHLVILAETEFWPNFLRLAKQRGVGRIKPFRNVSNRISGREGAIDRAALRVIADCAGTWHGGVFRVQGSGFRVQPEIANWPLQNANCKLIGERGRV